MKTLLSFFSVAFLAALAAASAVAGWPAALPLAYAGLSAATFGVYAHDKRAAVRRAARIPEASLHLWSLAGGWPGALLAQQLLRHKSAKGGFIAVLWLCIAVNLALLGALWRAGLLTA
jgi:uncharacterized membrane protein YsdA (DUF1294 family)